MWNLFIRLGMVLSTVLIAKQVADHLWPVDVQPTRVYRVEQVAKYLGASHGHVLALIEAGDLQAKWVDEKPLVLGMSILQFLSRGQQ